MWITNQDGVREQVPVGRGITGCAILGFEITQEDMVRAGSPERLWGYVREVIMTRLLLPDVIRSTESIPHGR